MSNHEEGVPFKEHIRRRQFVYELRINSSPKTRHLVRRSLLRHFNKIYDCDLNGVFNGQKMYQHIPLYFRFSTSLKYLSKDNKPVYASLLNSNEVDELLIRLIKCLLKVYVFRFIYTNRQISKQTIYVVLVIKNINFMSVLLFSIS